MEAHDSITHTMRYTTCMSSSTVVVVHQARPGVVVKPKKFHSSLFSYSIHICTFLLFMPSSSQIFLAIESPR